jgi:hypothetical protein
VSDALVIERRFRGPPDSANGGYACGVVGELLDPGDRWVESTLRVPPPLDHELEGTLRDDGTACLFDGENLVAEARFAAEEPQLEVPALPTWEQAEEAGRNSPWRGKHPFPMCFTCGSERTPPDGLHLETGPVGDRGILADAWIPHPDLAGADGEVDRRIVWAALDCPSGNGVIWFQTPAATVLLGRLTARLIEPVHAGERYFSLGWPAGHDGRKHWGGAALVHEPTGTLVGIAQGLWIELRQQ